MTSFVIVDRSNLHAVAEGSHACRVVWTKAFARARAYSSAEEAQASLKLLTDDGDPVEVMTVADWDWLTAAYLIARGRGKIPPLEGWA